MRAFLCRQIISTLWPQGELVVEKYLEPLIRGPDMVRSYKRHQYENVELVRGEYTV